MQKKGSRKDLLSRFQNSEIEVVFLRKGQVIFRTIDNTKRKFWQKLFGTETFILKDIKATFTGVPTIELTFEPLIDIEIDQVEVRFIDKGKTWLESTTVKPSKLKFLSKDTITLIVKMESGWDGT